MGVVINISWSALSEPFSLARALSLPVFVNGSELDRDVIPSPACQKERKTSAAREHGSKRKREVLFFLEDD